jgi:hypothetical protein
LKEKNVLVVAALAFLALLIIVFNEFVFDSSKFMLNSDALNGLGTYYMRAESLILSQWDNARLGGVPTLDAVAGSAYHPLALLRFAMDAGRAEGWIFIIVIWTAFISAFILGRYLTDKWQWGALLGFLYAFSPQYFTFVYGGHEGKMMVFGIAPFAMYALLHVLREASLKHLVYLTLSIIWMIMSAHIQLTYFFLWGAGLFVLYELFAVRAAKWDCPYSTCIVRLGLASLALALALMISAALVIPPYLYTTRESVRGTEEKTSIEHSASWSLHGEELAAIVLPGFLGIDVHKGQPKSDANVYWGQNPFKLNSDACGALLTFLALCGCLLPGNRRAALFWFFGCVIALSYAVGLHSFLFQVWYSIIPGVKNFRAPSMSMFWLPLAFVFMAAPVLKNLEGNKEVIKKGAILYGVLLAAILAARYFWESFSGFGAAVLVAAFGALFIKFQNDISTLSTRAKILWAVPFLIIASFFLNSVSGSYFKPVNFTAAENLFSHSVTSFAVIAAVLGAAFFVLSNDKMGIAQKALILAIAAAVDLAVVDYKFVQNVPAIQYHNPNHPVLQAIKKDSPNEAERPRVFSLTRQPSVSGNIFHAYNMRNALGFHDNEIATYRAFKEELQNQAMLDLMNVGYIIFDGERGTAVQKNPGDLGRARVYYKYETLEKPEEVRSKLKDSYFDYRNILLLEKNIANINGDGQQSVKTTKDKMDKITFEVESSENGILFISENYHKYWKAKVNGKDEEISRAFSTFMAVPVSSGKSVVELSYSSDAVKISLWIGLAGVILLLGVYVLRFLFKPSGW